jgi:FlaA1/EpsC-like NDP-sugar epimerase
VSLNSLRQDFRGANTLTRISAKIIPSEQELFHGRPNISQIPPTRIEELLGRDRIQVSEFDAEVRQGYSGKRNGSW